MCANFCSESYWHEVVAKSDVARVPSPLTLDLGGHTLTVNPNVFYFANATTTAGTLVLNGLVEFYINPSDFRASKTVVNGQLRVNKNCDAISFGDCEFNTPWADTSASYTGAIKVFGSLRPNTDFFHGCEMQDGSTLDLRGRSEPFRTKGRNIGTTDAMTTITFAPVPRSTSPGSMAGAPTTSC